MKKEPIHKDTLVLWAVSLAVVVVFSLLPLAYLFLPSLKKLAPVLIILPCAIAYTITILAYTRAGLVITTLFVPLQYILTAPLGETISNYAVLLDEFTLLIITCAWMAGNISRKGKIWTRTPIDVPLFLFIFVGFLSTILNGAPFFKAMFGIRQHVQYALIFYAIVNLNPPRSFIRGLLLISLAIAAIQLPIMIGQWDITEIILREQDAPDIFVGTMGKGGANAVGFFLLIHIGFLLGLFETGDRRYPRSFLLLFSLYLLIPFVMCGSRIGLVIFPVFILWLFYKDIRRPQYAVAGLILVGIMIVGCLYYVKNMLAEWGLTYSLETNISAETNPRKAGRIAYYGIGWDVLHTQSASPLIGTGPGTYSSYAARRFEPPLAQAYIYRTSPGVEHLIDSQIIATGVEYGYLGLVLFYVIILQFWRMTIRAYRTTEDTFWKGISKGYVATLMVATFVTPVINVWEIQYFAYYLWMWAGVMWCLQKSGEQAILQNPNVQII
jgi:hypothetical protein